MNKEKKKKICSEPSGPSRSSQRKHEKKPEKSFGEVARKEHNAFLGRHCQGEGKFQYGTKEKLQ